MGAVWTRVEEKQRNAALDSRLADIKQTKAARELDLATRLAATRDRLCFIGAYYAFVGIVAGCRHVSMHRRGVQMHWDNFFLPLNIPIVILPAFLFTYQLDLALSSPHRILGIPIGGKANRISEEAARIRAGELHRWFGHSWLPEVDDSKLFIHKPVCLPLAFEEAYQRAESRTARERSAKGSPPARPWAYFEEACPTRSTLEE